MENQNKNVSRKKMISWGIGFTALLALPSFLRFSKKKKETRKVKMLTQDGKLVEIDVVNIPAKKKKIQEADIHTWVSKKPTL